MQELINVLTQAASQVDHERQSAEARLAQFECIPHFWANLLQIYFEPQINQRVRSLSIICIKNGVSKYWRKSAAKVIPEEEKRNLRQSLLSNFSETHKPLSSQQALVVSMIARFDFPNDWPDLLTTLIPLAEHSFSSQSPDSDTIQLNTLYTLHLCMKQIATKSLPAARKSLRDETPEVFRFMLNVFHTRCQNFFETPLTPQNVDKLDAFLSVSRVALKCMRRLIVYGFTSVLESPTALNLLAVLYQYLPRFLEAKRLTNESKTLSKTLSSISILIGKVYMDLQDGAVIDFIIAPHCIDVVKYYWSILENANDLTAADPTMENILLQGLKLVKNIVKHPEITVVTPRIINLML